MMDRTDRHFRYLLRLLSSDAVLYTEMVVAQAVKHGDKDRLLGYDPSEHPLVLQLGGSEPDILASAAAEGERRGYDAINLNIGCPSDRVQSGAFGACLMSEPALVADGVRAIRDRIAIPVSVKTRIGIDDHDSYGFLRDFIEPLIDAGCQEFAVHARKALLSGLSPAENRSIPPLRYETVYRLKQDYPELHISINGGVRTTAEVLGHLQHVDGVMIGRQAYKEPYWIAELQEALSGTKSLRSSRREVVSQMAEYAEVALSAGARLNHITRHMLGLFAGQPGARAWRRYLSENAYRPNAGPDILSQSLRYVDRG